MPHVLFNAPVTLQSAMDSILKDLKLKCVLVYLKNITVFSADFTDHLKHLKSVFLKLRDAGMNLNSSKCSFFWDFLEFLVREVTTTVILSMDNKSGSYYLNASPLQSSVSISLFRDYGLLTTVHQKLCLNQQASNSPHMWFLLQIFMKWLYSIFDKLHLVRARPVPWLYTPNWL